MNWKTTGFKITKKLIYYVLIICGVIFLGSVAANMMTARDTLQNIVGAVLAASTIGATITIGIREVDQFCNKINEETNKINEKTN